MEADFTITSMPHVSELHPKIDITKLRETLLRQPIRTCRSFSAETNYNSFISSMQQAQKCSSKPIPTPKTNRRHSKPWVDHDLLIAIRTKNYWYAKHRKNISDEFVRGEYREWCNKVTLLKRSKMKQYYATKFERSKESVSKTWNAINEVLGSKKKHDAITSKSDTVKKNYTSLKISTTLQKLGPN